MRFNMIVYIIYYRYFFFPLLLLLFLSLLRKNIYMKHLLTIADETNEACSESFRRIAEKLMNLYQLQVKDNFYRIIDCEFYYSSKKHQDPYAHGHERQKSKGEWYFHGSGLDITIGNGEALGGI